ncbi:MAG TPA: hypothetical protein VFU31_30450 [Candidatus Binatia bacterium]|nr:hypothetical protein [Candidatus Binatia bacterium]
MTTSTHGSNNADLFPAQTAGTTNPKSFPVIRLEIRGVDNIASFKNQKQIISLPIKGSQKCKECGKRDVRPMLITKPERQQQMKSITESLESQLYSALATTGLEITMAPIPLSKIASLLPLDDSRQWIPELCVSTLLVAKGEEGADITIERIK